MANEDSQQVRAAMDERRRRLVEVLRARGIGDEQVLDAMGSVPRHRFVADHLADLAYEDRPLVIGRRHTISQPYIVALMAESAAVDSTHRVLEVGTGSGYGAAVLATLAASVVTIERHDDLARRAEARRRDVAPDTVTVVVGDGSQGWPAAAPYDAVVVTACAPTVPQALIEQLADGGRLIIPVGHRRRVQTLLRIRRRGDRTTSETLGSVRFVPLISDRS